jgi:hypothetical protein
MRATERDAALIAAHITARGITKCRPRRGRPVELRLVRRRGRRPPRWRMH